MDTGTVIEGLNAYRVERIVDNATESDSIAEIDSTADGGEVSD